MINYQNLTNLGKPKKKYANKKKRLSHCSRESELKNKDANLLNVLFTTADSLMCIKYLEKQPAM